MKKELSSPLTPIDFLRASRILQVAVASVIHPAEEYSFRAHKPCEICVVRHGHCVMNIAGEDIPLKEGEFIFILPYVSHARYSISILTLISLVIPCISFLRS